MPTYCVDLEIPKSTPEDSPVEKKLKIKEGVITRWLILCPAGMHALARARVLYGLEPLLPAHEDAWIRGEDESLNVDEFWDPPEEPYKLRFQGFNLDDTYDHTFYIRVVVLPREVALTHRLFLKRIGEEISEAFMRAAGYV
jgi:hypothetical protein